MTAEETQTLHDLMRKQFNGREPRHFQVNLTKAQEERQDAICQAATGMGKTAVAAGPYVLPKNERRVTIMISPLIGLQNEMVCQPFINHSYHIGHSELNFPGCYV
jgi:ERCC4-related helicase